MINVTFLFIELSKILNSFLKIRLVLEIKNVSLKKVRFYLKRGCIKMRKHEKTFHAHKGCKLVIVFFIPISLFLK